MTKRKRKKRKSRAKRRAGLPVQVAKADVARDRPWPVLPILEEAHRPMSSQPCAEPARDEPGFILDDAARDEITTIAQEEGMLEAEVYAVKKTGLIIVRGINDYRFTAEQKAEWQAAIDEFNAMS